MTCRCRRSSRGWCARAAASSVPMSGRTGRSGRSEPCGVAQGRTVRRLFWKGVANWRQNLPTLPLFRPPTGYKREPNSQVPGIGLDWRWGKIKGVSCYEKRYFLQSPWSA
jgi:hypothetical protein